VMYTLFALVVGVVHVQASRTAPHPGNTTVRRDDDPQTPVAHVGRQW
jgi:hypothetical protein